MLKSSKDIKTTATIGASAPVLETFGEFSPLKVQENNKSLKLINPGDIQSIENLGEQYSGILQNLSASLAQSDTKLKSMGEIGNNITTLMSTVKTLDPELINNKPSFIGKLLGRAKDGVTTFIDKQKSVVVGADDAAATTKRDAIFLAIFGVPYPVTTTTTTGV